MGLQSVWAKGGLECCVLTITTDSCTAIIVPRLALRAVSATYIGIVEVFMPVIISHQEKIVCTLIGTVPFPTPDMSRPAISCGAPYVEAWMTAPMIMITLPQIMVCFLPRSLPNTAATIQPPRQPML